MLDIKFIRENSELVKQKLEARGSDIDLSVFLSIDEKRREVLQKIEVLRAERNRASDEIAKSKKEKKEIGPSVFASMKELSSQVRLGFSRGVRRNRRSLPRNSNKRVNRVVGWTGGLRKKNLTNPDHEARPISVNGRLMQFRPQAGLYSLWRVPAQERPSHSPTGSPTLSRTHGPIPLKSWL